MIASANLLTKIDRLQVGDISSASDHSPVYFDLTTKPGSTFCINKLSLYSGDLLSDLLDRMASTGDDIDGNHNNTCRRRATRRDQSGVPE